MSDRFIALSATHRITGHTANPMASETVGLIGKLEPRIRNQNARHPFLRHPDRGKHQQGRQDAAYRVGRFEQIDRQ